MKKRMAIFIVLISLLFSTVVVYAQHKIVDGSTEHRSTQYEATLLYNEMMLEFARLYGESDGYPSSYPKYYAGSYINGDDKLVIKFVDRSIMNTSENLDNLKRLLSSIYVNKSENQSQLIDLNDIVVFEPTLYSYNEMTTKLDSLISNSTDEILGGYIDERGSSVVVFVENSESIEQFFTMTRDSNVTGLSKEINSLIPVKVEISEISQPSANHISGQGPYTHGNAGGVTLGFTGRYSGKKAYLTCGHTSAFSVGSSAKYQSSTIGTVASKRWVNNGSGDWAIITLLDSQSITGIIKKNGSGSSAGKISSRLNYVPVGATVYRYGNQSKTWSSDKVQAINVQKSWWSNGEGSAAYTIKGLVKTSVISGAYPQLGDSGGPIVLSEGNNNYAAVGTFTGFNLSGDLYYSPMSHVPSGFTVEIGYDGDLP